MKGIAELTKTEKLKATRLLFAGGIAELIATGVVYLTIVILTNLEPIPAAFLSSVLFISAGVGCGLVYVWLGDPNNKFWNRAENIRDTKIKEEQIGQSKVATITENKEVPK